MGHNTPIITPMISSKKYLPFGLSSGFVPRFIAIVLLVFSGLIFLDAPATRAAAVLPDWVKTIFTYITYIGDAEWILIPSLAIALAGGLVVRFRAQNTANEKIKHWSTLAAFIFLSTAGPGLFANLLKRLIGRARPIHFEELGLFHFQPVFNDWTFQSIPSGHTSTMFAFATGIMFVFPKLRWWAFGLAALVGLSRIVIGMHYPTDVFAGLLTGVIAAYVVRNIFLSRDWIFEKTDKGEIVAKHL